jgi:hypothetical protein
VVEQVREQGRRLGFYPEEPPGRLKRWTAMASGTLLFARSQLSRSRSQLDKSYLRELGFPSRNTP